MKGNGGIKIEKGIPAPALSKYNKYPWDEMNVGDSFLFPPDIKWFGESARTASLRRAPKKFIARQTPEGPRCWRVE